MVLDRGITDNGCCGLTVGDRGPAEWPRMRPRHDARGGRPIGVLVVDGGAGAVGQHPRDNAGAARGVHVGAA
jgi:hypothetical protein